MAGRLDRLLGRPSAAPERALRKQLAVARRKERALVLIAECDRIQTLIAETRQRWAERRQA